VTTYAWPTSRHFVPATHELRVVDNTQRTAESALSGYVQTTGMPGARWGWGMDFAPHTQAQRAEVEGYLLRLSGRQHRVQLWDLRNPRPRGSLALTGVTLGAAAAQFATSLTLAGCRGANAVPGGSFEADSNADGVADGWQRYTSGTVVGAAQSLSTGGTHGTYAQLCQASGMGTTAGDQQGVWQSGVPVASVAGTAVTYSAKVYGSGGTGRVYVEFLNSGLSVVGTLNATTALTGSWQTVSASGVVPASAVTASVYVWQQAVSGVGPHFVYMDEAQLRTGGSGQPYQSGATLLAGDWLGLTGGQLVRVVADATATDAGAMTVEVRHMLRAAVASGTAVTLDKPTALYVRTEAGIALPRMPGNVDPGMSLDLVEVFA
jgi:hypothetical protein